MDPGGRDSAAGFEEVPLLYPSAGCAQTQEPLLLYLAATNQVVSAALVAQREVDEEAAAAAESADGKPEPSPAGLGPGKTESPAEAETSATGPARLGEVV